MLIRCRWHSRYALRHALPGHRISPRPLGPAVKHNCASRFNLNHLKNPDRNEAFDNGPPLDRCGDDVGGSGDRPRNRTTSVSQRQNIGKNVKPVRSRTWSSAKVADVDRGTSMAVFAPAAAPAILIGRTTYRYVPSLQAHPSPAFEEGTTPLARRHGAAPLTQAPSLPSCLAAGERHAGNVRDAQKRLRSHTSP